MSMHWFALRVKPRHEKAVAEALRSKGFEDFLPLQRVRRRWSDRRKELWLPLFSQYVFCHLDLAIRLPVLSVPGVRNIVGFGNGPMPVDEQEVQALRKITDAGLPASPHAYLTCGQRVRLIDGPLSGVEGIFKSVDGAGRLIVSVTLLQRSLAVDVQPEWVAPVSSSDCGRGQHSTAATFPIHDRDGVRVCSVF